MYGRVFLLTGAVHFLPQEYFDFLKENLVAQKLLKVLREFPKLSLLTGAVQVVAISHTSK